ncbi:hypothetical protein EV643_108121 [Kribbella sp. VKM Ac-2527]|uniref:Uncharacterized protein n=1 Tax=Kribbella caucasensis TaxID=2512215 RepID=A0A4V3C9X9_9ACTN|nr:hypothetical protein [Kribbella sp. VKM Ac-2527]TDO47807.1 hypothetical protein EV643_108121 [Kribbella sp. VKM Ac-2527]
MIRRTLTAAIAAIGLAAVSPLAASASRPLPVLPKGPAASAQAAGTCNVSVPTRVAISRPILVLPGKISGDCVRAGNSSVWDLNHPSKGYQNFIGWDDRDPELDGTWWVFSDDAIGNQTFQPAGSKNYNDGVTYTQNSVPVTVKLAAGAWISSSRTADVVTLKGTSLLYSVSNNNFFKRSAAGVFQFREIGSTQWQTLKAGVWTNSKGEVSMAYRYSKTRDYRFALYSTSISWDLGSAATRR